MRTIAIVAILATAGCTRMIDPAKHSGPDGKYGGARPIELDQQLAGEASGIVTYPGGDRVDWKKIELPVDQQGTLSLELSWRSPRPGLDLAFEVWDEWGKKIGEVSAKKWNSKKKAARRASAHKKTTVEGVKGTVYVSVFASTRGDAGRYKLEAAFSPAIAKYDPRFDEVLQKMLHDGLVIEDPPKLGEVFPLCGDDYDKQNPDCVENPPACNRDKPDKSNPSCKKLCNKDALDPKNPDCAQFYAACTPDTWVDPAVNPNCKNVTKTPPPPIEPVKSIVQNVSIKDDGKVWIEIRVGKESLVATGWTGTLMDGKNPLKNGGFKVIKVVKGVAYAVVDVPLDTANDHLSVEIYPPVTP